VDSRAAYDAIVASRLFGLAGQVAQESAKEPEPAPVEEVETKLRLKLCGTAATFPTDPLATAIIMNQDKNTMGTYYIGQDVVDQVSIKEIYQRKVVLFNKQTNQREVLLAEELKGETKAGSASPLPGSAPVPASASASASASTSASTSASAPTKDRVSIKKSELVQELFTNYSEMAQTIKPEMYRDENGKVAGITASNLESIPLAKKLDVRNGDVLQTVNNEAIDSEQKVMDLIQKYQNATTLRVGLLRDGKPIVVTYRLE
jgi:general secretion pathway protein C